MTSCHSENSLVLFGAGKMGASLLSAWFRQGWKPQDIALIDPQPSPEAMALISANNISLNQPPASPEIIILAVKPQTAKTIMPQVKSMARPKTFILSIMAGKTLAWLEAHAPPSCPVIRAMPNTPAQIGRGITVLTANKHTQSHHKTLASRLLQAAGKIEWIEDEGLMDAVTAVSGSGPAYVFLLTEILAKAGEAAGLSKVLAEKLARETISGAGELLHQSEMPPATLRANVTSPGGTTAAALDVLMAENKLEQLMYEAVRAAARRSRELSGQ